MRIAIAANAFYFALFALFAYLADAAAKIDFVPVANTRRPPYGKPLNCGAEKPKRREGWLECVVANSNGIS